MVLMSDAFYDGLREAGVLGDDPPRVVSKVVIVAQAGEPLRIFVEYLGEEGWLDAPALMTGLEVHTHPPLASDKRPGSVSYYDLGEGGPKAR